MKDPGFDIDSEQIQELAPAIKKLNWPPKAQQLVLALLGELVKVRAYVAHFQDTAEMLGKLDTCEVIKDRIRADFQQSMDMASQVRGQA